MEIDVVNSGYLIFTTRRGFNRADNVKNSTIIKIDTYHRVIALRTRRLLLNRNNAIVVQNRNAVTPRIWHLLEHDAGTLSLRKEIRNRRPNRRFKNVIAQKDDNPATGSEPLR